MKKKYFSSLISIKERLKKIDADTNDIFTQQKIRNSIKEIEEILTNSI